MTTWTSVLTGSITYTAINLVGENTYDDAGVIYDDPNVYFDSNNNNQWTSVLSGSGSWTSVVSGT